MISLLRRWLGVWFIAASVGCVLSPGTARDLASTTPPLAINSTLRALNEEENQRLVVRLLASPEVREATRALAAALADGTMSAMTEPERVERIEQISSRYVATLTRSVTRSMAEGLRSDLAPALAQMTRVMVSNAMREAMREGYQRDLERVASGVSRASADAASRGMAEGITRDLVPAMREALLNEQTAGAMRTAIRSLAREAVLGSNEAMTQIQRQQDRGAQPSFLSRLSSMSEDGVRIMRLVTVIAIVLVLALGVWVLRLVLRGRRVAAESERNAASAVLFAQAIRAAEGKPWSKELTEILQERLKDDAVAGMLDEVLKPRPPSGRRRRPA